MHVSCKSVSVNNIRIHLLLVITVSICEYNEYGKKQKTIYDVGSGTLTMHKYTKDPHNFHFI